jgi:hypothetical protein
MSYKRYLREAKGWGIPAIYAAVAMTAGLTLPHVEGRWFPGLVLPMSVSSATAIYSSVASGMIALTGIVFSLAFVMVQFSATAYSPRLVLWIARDPMLSHALGVFTATFLYAIAALTGVDRNASGKVPFISAWIVVGLLIASVGMFVGLIQGIGLLQVNRMLIFTGDRGRRVIATTYRRAIACVHEVARTATGARLGAHSDPVAHDLVVDPASPYRDCGWAFLYSWQGCLPNVEAAFYFSGTTYTSVGYGDLVLAKPWRLLGPLESLTGILMCGLSTGFFFVIVSRMYQSLSVETPAIK